MYVGKLLIDEGISGAGKIKARVGKKPISIAISTTGQENAEFLGTYYPYVIQCYEDGEARAFYTIEEAADGESGFYRKVMFILRSEDSDEVFDVAVEEHSDDASYELSLESFFGGEYRLELKDDLNDLLHRYDPTGYGKIYAAAAAFVVLLIAGWGVNSYLEKQALQEKAAMEAAAQNAAPKPILPLSSAEVSRLKSEASKAMIDTLKERVSIIAGNDKLNGKTSIRSLSSTYEASEDSVTLKGVIGYEFSYPVEGSSLSSEGVYSKNEGYAIARKRDDLDGIVKTGMSVACVRMAMEIDAQEAVVAERTAQAIRIKYTQMKPSALLGSFRSMLDQCPAHIDMIGMGNERFDLVATIYDAGDL